jgi:hypothetical protein
MLSVFVVPLGHHVIEEAGCILYFCDINIFPLLKIWIIYFIDAKSLIEQSK